MQNKKSQHKWALRLASISIAILLMFSFGLSVMAEDIPADSASEPASAASVQETVIDDASDSSSVSNNDGATNEPQVSKVSIIAFEALADVVQNQSFPLVGIASQDEINLPASLVATTADDAPVTIEGVTWACAEFDIAIAGAYTFAATLSEGFVLAEGIAAPIITVLLREETPLGGPIPFSINPVTVSALPSTTSYQTFINLDNGTTPQDLTINLSVAVQPGLEKATIELPLGYRPTATGSHPNFSMTEDIFTLVRPVFPADSIFESYNVKPGALGEEDTLVLTINDKLDSARAESLALRFNFNDNYKGKIDTGSNLWKMQATASVNGANVHTDVAQDIKTSAKTEIRFSTGRFVPVDKSYTGDTLGMRATTHNQYYYQADFDPAYTNIIYIEVPTGTVPGGIITDYYDKGPFDSSTNIEIPVGYDRYYKIVENTKAFWSVWQHLGNPFNVFSMKDIRIVPPALPIGEKFNIRLGADYQKMNGAVRKENLITEYTVAEPKEWYLYFSKYHATGDAYPATVNTTPGSIGTAVNASYSQLINLAATKNLGTKNITGVSLVLKQASTDSGKVSFHEIQAKAEILDSNYLISYFRWDYTIKNVDPASNPDKTMSTTALKGNSSLTLPALATGEYIDDIKLIPMGTDGFQEGVLPPKNSIGIRYYPKAWDGEVWPDGTPVPYHTPVPMSWRLFHNDKDGNPFDSGKGKDGGSIMVNYTKATSAYANIVSSNANGKKPGETVNYEIQGYNRRLHGIGQLVNPRVVVAVPIELELQNIGDAKDFVDKSNTTTTTGCVDVSIVSSTATHNYYVFQANGVEGSIVASTPSFTIPLEFKVADSTKEGSYDIPAVAITTDNPPGFLNVENFYMNNLAAYAGNMGFAATDNYAGTGTWTGAGTNIRSTPLTVVSSLKLATSTAIKSIATGNAWNNAATVPADNGETVSMKITLSNAGNTTFNNVKIYNILPSNGDALGSTGSISFAGIVASGATIWYTADAIGGLPAYGTDLSAGKPLGPTWTQTLPSNATAVYIDFGTLKVAGGDDLDLEMKFAVPATGEQTAYNKFQYYAEEVSQAKTKIESISSMAGFSTNAIALMYVPNLPTPLPSGVTVASDMPIIGDSGILGIKPDNKLIVDASVPTLGGYTFVKWQDAANASNNYVGGDGIVFTAKGTVTLKAIWAAASYPVVYNGNGHTGGTMANGTATFNANFTLAANAYTKTGSDFKGWNTNQAAANAGTVEHGAGKAFTPWTQASGMTLYAVWKTNSYAVEYNGNGHTAGTMANGTATLNSNFKLATNAYTKTGYSVIGWNTNQTAANAGTVEYIDEYTFTPWTQASDMTLYAVWKTNDYILTFDAQGGTPVPNPQTVAYLDKAQKPADPSLIGNGFAGWFSASTGGTKWNFVNNTMPANNLILYAQYVPIKYNVTFNYGGAQINDRTISVAYASLISKPTNPSWAGNTFQGWKGEDGKAWDFSKNTMPNRNITITAVWNNLSYTVRFLNWDGAQLKTQTVAWNNDAAPPANPTKAGWTFSGWNGNYTSVTKNEIVTATFTENPIAPITPTPPAPSSSSRPTTSGGGTGSSSSSDRTTTSSSGGTRTGSASSSSGGTGGTTSSSSATSGQSSSSQSATILTDENVPLAGPIAAKTWSLLSLLVSLGSFFISIYLVLSVFRKKKIVVINENGDKEERFGKTTFNLFRIFSILAGALTIVLFFIFNNISNTMVWVNNWTPLILITFVVHILFNIIGYRKQRNNEENKNSPAAT